MTATAAQKKLTPKQKQALELQTLIKDFTVYCPLILRIVPKAGGLIPLDLNIFQLFIHYHIEKQLERKGYVRVIVLKPRQLGCSTYIQARYYGKTSTEHGVMCIIMTHEDKATTHLFNMAKTFYDHTPPDLRPERRLSNAIELVFDDKVGMGLKSRYVVQTAQSKGGRSMTPRLVHFSEYAYYGDQGMKSVGGILAGMPKEERAKAGTEVFIESTANGVGEPFHRKWTECRRAQKAGKEPEYLPLFFPWYWYPQYTITVGYKEKKEINATLTKYEEWLLEQACLNGKKVSLGQLAWRRLEIENCEPPVGMSKENFFKQEYPATEEEAFVHSGSSIFESGHVKAAKEECCQPEFTARLNTDAGTFYANKDGELLVWERPIRGTMYVIGADVGEGLVGGDYSCADVLRVPDGVQVAQWHGHIAPDLFGVILYYLGHFYGPIKPALLGIEANNHGHTTITKVRDMGYRFIYMRDQVDAHSGKKVKKFGFLTTSATKYEIIDNISAALREGNSGIMSEETCDELSTYIKHNDGSYGAASGNYDDRVMSLAIAKKVLREVPTVQRFIRSNVANGYNDSYASSWEKQHART